MIDTNMEFIGPAIVALRPGALFSVMNGNITWEDTDQSQPTEEEILAKMDELIAADPLRRLREERNYRLTQTDWVNGGDVPQATKDAWYPYRQALRDITDTYTSLDDVVWPTKPE